MTWARTGMMISGLAVVLLIGGCADGLTIPPAETHATGASVNASRSVEGSLGATNPETPQDDSTVYPATAASVDQDTTAAPGGEGRGVFIGIGF